MNTETKTVDSGTIYPEDSIVQHIEIDMLQEFKGHAFKSYCGKKLDQLTQSIKENGVMQPIIFRPTKNSYMFEIVSGHNRRIAVEQAVLTTIPAVVQKLSDDKAAILANETNITQRSFKDWLPSEKAKSIHQYHEAVKKQGKRSANKANAFGGNSQKDDDYARTKTANVYGVKGNIIRLYLNIHRLTDQLLDQLDNGNFGITAAQALSFISPAGQILVNTVLEGDKDVYKVTVNNSQKLRMVLKDYTGEDAKVEEKVKKLLDRELSYTSESSPTTERIKNIPLVADLYAEWFSDQPVEYAVEVLKAAMNTYLEYDANKSVDKTDEIPEPQDPPQ